MVKQYNTTKKGVKMNSMNSAGRETWNDLFTINYYSILEKSLNELWIFNAQLVSGMKMSHFALVL